MIVVTRTYPEAGSLPKEDKFDLISGAERAIKVVLEQLRRDKTRTELKTWESHNGSRLHVSYLIHGKALVEYYYTIAVQQDVSIKGIIDA